jgi:tape measure domain-containing protein
MIWPSRALLNLRRKRLRMVVRELITLLGYKLNDADVKKYDKQIDSTKQRQESLFSSMFKAQAIYNVASRVIGSAFSFVKQSIFEVAGETEKYRASLGAMIGDQEKANKIIHELDYSPLSDFYGTAAAIGGLQGLVTMGVQAEEASDVLLRLGDIAGGSGEALKSLGLNMGQVFAKGKADATDLKQFVTQGFDVVGVIAQQTGKTREQVEKAGVTYQQTAAALRVLTSEGGKYYGLMQKNMNTIPGVIAQIKSFVAATQEAIGFGVSNEIKELLKSILAIGRSMQETFVAAGIKAIKEILIWIAMVHVAFVRLSSRLADAGGVFGNIKELARAFFSFFASLVRSIFPVILSVAEILIRAFGPVKAFIIPILEALKPIAADVFGAINDMLDPVKKAVTGLSEEFGFVGDKVAELLGKARPVLNNIMLAIKAAFEPIKAFVLPIIEALKPIFMDVFNALSGLLDNVGESTSGLAGFIEKLTPIFRELGEFVGDIVKGLWYYKDVIMALVTVYGIWTAAQWALNAASAVNPVTWIILGIVALIFVIYELIKHWDTIKGAFIKTAKAVADGVKTAWEKIVSVAKGIWDRVVSVVQAVVDRIKAAWEGMVNAVAMVVVMVRLIIERVWNGIAAFVQTMIDGITGAWQAFSGFMGGLWEGIKNIAGSVWEGIKNTISGVIDGIRGVWQGLVDFISPFWDWFGQKASDVWEGVKNTFVSAVDFIRGVWEGFVGFFTGAWDKIKGAFSTVADFFGFSGPEPAAAGSSPASASAVTGSGARPVGDMILTPEGRFDTDPADYIMAMKNPADLSGRAAYHAASPVNQYSNSRQSVSINVTSQITAAVPAGTPAEQKAALQRQAREAVHNEWAQVIQGARGLIPSPERRGAL